VAIGETVTVTGSSPVVDTTSANTAVNLSERLQARQAGVTSGRCQYKVPSLLITRPDVGGRRAACRAPTTRGTTSRTRSISTINVGDRRQSARPASITTSTRSRTSRSRPARTTSPCRRAACS
jgi:hypothetical protein